MRFCPFCSAENGDELAVCQQCGRRLPPLPPRRARAAPATGVQLPPRAPSVPPSGPRPMPGAAPSPSPSPSPLGAPPSPLGAPPSPPGAPPPSAAVSGALPPPSPPPPGPPSLPPSGPRPIPSLSAAAPPPVRAKPASIPPLTPPPPLAPPPAMTPMTPPAPRPMPAGARPSFDDDFNTVQSASAYPDTAPAAVPLVPSAPVVPSGPTGPIIAAGRDRPSFDEPPPTHIQRNEAHVDRPFTPPKLVPIPEVPEPSLLGAARYTVRFGRARWQRRGAIKVLGAEIKQDTEALDQVLGALGRAARGAGVDSRVFSAENTAIDAAEERIAALGKEQSEVEGRRSEENSKFVDVEAERNTKLGEAERMAAEAQRELAHLEGQRRSLRDARKELERRQKAHLKGAEDSERASTSAQVAEQRQEHRRAAEQFRREAAALEPERQEVDRRLGALERPISEATARLDAAKAELDAAKRSLADAREGHTHRLAELDAEQKRKAREIATAEAEIARRLVTLGTLVNLNRIEDPRFDELYQRIDRLRGAITARTTEIEKLTAEREAYDRGTIVRGISAIGGALVAFIALIVILRALL